MPTPLSRDQPRAGHQRLLLMVLGLLVGLLSLAAVGFYQRYETVTKSHYAETQLTHVNQAAQHLTEVFDEMQKFLSLLAQARTTVDATDPAARNLVRHMVQLLANHGVVAGVISGHGATVVVPQGALDGAALASVAAAEKVCPPGNDICLARAPGPKGDLIVVSAQDGGGAGDSLASLALVGDWNAIGERTLRELRTDRWGQVFVLGSDGTILSWGGQSACAATGHRGVAQRCSDCHADYVAPTDPAGQGVHFAVFRGVRHIVTTAIASAGTGHMVIGTVAPADASLAEIRPVLRVGGVVLVTIVLLLIFIAWLSRREGLTQLRALAAAHAEVRRLNEGLEQRVASRTADLEEVHARLLAGKRELAAQDRMAAIGEMAATFAHEVRTPLNALSIATQRLNRMLVKHGSVGPEMGGDALRDQKENINVINDYVERYLRVARRSRELPIAFALPALVTEVFELLRPDAEAHNVTLRAAMADDLPEPVLARGSVRHILINLVTNAIQAQPSGGDVVVRADVQADALHIEVEDRGPGIDVAQAEQVFEFFATWRPGGTGLGLSISRRFAADLGGTLICQRGADGGAIFALTLPLTAKIQNDGETK